MLHELKLLNKFKQIFYCYEACFLRKYTPISVSRFNLYIHNLDFYLKFENVTVYFCLTNTKLLNIHESEFMCNQVLSQ